MCIAELQNWKPLEKWSIVFIDQIPDPFKDWSQCHQNQIPDQSLNFSNQAWFCDPNGIFNKSDGRNLFS